MINRLLFLTSTVKPSVIPYWGSVEVRKKEYINAIKFYLERTPYKILIVDNSGYDFNVDFPNEGRLEALSFVETSKNIKGKGYGEILLMEYGFKHSKFIREADQIVKITGRHIIKNIEKLLTFCNQGKAVYVDSTLKIDFARSYFFVAPKSFYISNLFLKKELMNDGKGVYLEHILAQSIREWMNNKNLYYEFFRPIYIEGRPGISAVSYKTPSLNKKILIATKYLLMELKKKIVSKW